MYYSYFSTGNVRIDSEHANIDCMIDLCRTKDDAWVPAAQVLIAALANHLDSEEAICREDGLTMTSDHLAEHHQLKKRLVVIEALVTNAEVEKEMFLSSFRDMLFYHISNFDKYLVP
jgi:hemerythrin-like metal-binding protein